MSEPTEVTRGYAVLDQHGKTYLIATELHIAKEHAPDPPASLSLFGL